MAIKCGKCKNHHDSVDQVRACCLADQQVPGLPGVTYGDAAATVSDYIPTPRGYAVVKELRHELAAELAAIIPDHDKFRLATCLPGEGERVRFFRVDTPLGGKWAGCVFIKEQAGDDVYPVKGAAREETVLRALLKFGAKEGLLMYAKELESCGICGRTLTDEASRARGIGPVCADKVIGAF